MTDRYWKEIITIMVCEFIPICIIAGNDGYEILMGLEIAFSDEMLWN
jgi:hypothetical protein